jgi:hypothetical protein
MFNYLEIGSFDSLLFVKGRNKLPSGDLLDLKIMLLVTIRNFVIGLWAGLTAVRMIQSWSEIISIF